jgi:hypothetical protein
VYRPDPPHHPTQGCRAAARETLAAALVAIDTAAMELGPEGEVYLMAQLRPGVSVLDLSITRDGLVQLCLPGYLTGTALTLTSPAAPAPTDAPASVRV